LDDRVAPSVLMAVVVSAVIVTMKQREPVVRCIASVLVALESVEGETEVVVIDNGSTDGTVERVRTEFPNVRVVERGRNTGFASGAAEGVRQTTGDWILFLNDDAEIEHDAVAAMLTVAETHECVGSVAAKLLFADSDRINSAGLSVDRLGVGYDRHVGSPASAGETEPVEIFGASAGCALMRRAMLADIGGIDETFFMYLEDLDVAWRARARHWRSLYVPHAVAHHHHSLTARHGSDFKYFHVGRNRVRALAKNASTSHLVRYAVPMIVYDLAYIGFVALTDRSLAPLHGRIQGLREWRRYRRAVTVRDSSALEPVRGFRAALSRRSVWISESAGVPKSASRHSSV
jgi:GT2 family glycosyltransferase